MTTPSKIEREGGSRHTDADVEDACNTLRKAIEAAENSNHAGEIFVLAAVAKAQSEVVVCRPEFEKTLDDLAQLCAGAIQLIESAESDTNWGQPTFGPSYSEDHLERLEALHEPIADLFIYLSGKRRHASDCATSNAPAYLPRPCDCTYREVGQ